MLLMYTNYKSGSLSVNLRYYVGIWL